LPAEPKTFDFWRVAKWTFHLTPGRRFEGSRQVIPRAVTGDLTLPNTDNPEGTHCIGPKDHRMRCPNRTIIPLWHPTVAYPKWLEPDSRYRLSRCSSSGPRGGWDSPIKFFREAEFRLLGLTRFV